MIKKRLYKSILFIAIWALLLSVADFNRIPPAFAAFSYAEGNGTIHDPYIIMDEDGLDHVRDRLNAHYKLGADIDLTNFDDGDGLGWMPIGDFNHNFSGSFDGAGYVIEGLHINRPDMQLVGLFGSTLGATIKNVALHHVDITGLTVVGGLAGSAWDSDGAGLVDNCYVTGTVSAGTISFNGYVGGLIGQNFIAIHHSHASVDVVGNWEVGGLVGINYGFIDKSYATGNVNGGYDVGGLVGSGYYVDRVNGTRLTSEIQNSYATGTVTGTNFVGGLVGSNTGFIRNSYAIGNVSGNTSGGLAGENRDTIEESYWNSDSTSSNNSLGNPLTSLEMQLQASYAPTWDFDTVWGLVEEQGYPHLPPVLVLRSADNLTSDQVLDIELSARFGSIGQPVLLKYEMVSNATNMAVADDSYYETATGENETYSLDLSLQDMQPGDYQLRIWAETAAGLKSDVRTASFTVVDTTAPIGGNIIAGNITHDSIELNWSEAEDNSTIAENLRYRVVYSTSNNIATVSDAETNGIVVQDWTTNLMSQVVSGLSANSTYYFNVMVMDEAGNLAVYEGVSATTSASPFHAIGTISDYTFPALTVGYTSGAQMTKTETIIRIGNADLHNLTVSLSGSHASAFVLSPPAATTLDDGTPSTSFALAAIDNLPEGTYTAVVTIVADHMANMTFTVTQSVNEPVPPVSNVTPPPIDISPYEIVDVLVNGEPQQVGLAAATETNGRKTVTITIDQEKFIPLIENSALVTVPVLEGNDVIVSEWNGQIMKFMENKEAVIRIQTERATYTLPAEFIDIENMAKRFGADISIQNIQIRIAIAIPSDETINAIETAAALGNYEVIVPPLRFTITAAYGDQTIPIETFNTYVERTIALPDEVDPDQIMTGVVLEADGTLRHVPTKIVFIEGKYYAKVSSLSNSAYAIMRNKQQFADIATHWAKDSIHDMGARGIITGLDGDRYHPDQAVTRAEFAAIVVRGLGLKLESEAGAFSDVSPSEWFSKAVHTATSYQLIRGFEDGTFRPHEQITREEAIVIIARSITITQLRSQLFAQSSNEMLERYLDASEISEWARPGMTVGLQSGIILGRSPISLAPKAVITRAEAAVMVKRLLEKSDLI